MKKINLSFAAAKYLFPVYLNPLEGAKNLYANKILEKMLNGRRNRA